MSGHFPFADLTRDRPPERAARVRRMTLELMAEIDLQRTPKDQCDSPPGPEDDAAVDEET